MSETTRRPTGETASETRGGAPAWVREAAGLAALLVGLAGAILCLVHLGWWFAGFLLATFLVLVGTVSIMHRDEAPVSEIEIQLPVRDDHVG